MCNKASRPGRGTLQTNSTERYMGFPKIRGTLSGAPIVRILIYWGLLGSPYLGKLAHQLLGNAAAPSIWPSGSCKRHSQVCARPVKTRDKRLDPVPSATGAASNLPGLGPQNQVVAWNCSDANSQSQVLAAYLRRRVAFVPGS